MLSGQGQALAWSRRLVSSGPTRVLCQTTRVLCHWQTFCHVTVCAVGLGADPLPSRNRLSEQKVCVTVDQQREAQPDAS
eukprot:3080471-Rhodomonas_salina.2